MKKMIKYFTLSITLSCIWGTVVFAQTTNPSDVIPQIYPGAIPSSPAFSLLGVNPEIVTRPSDIKEFKVDWRVKNYEIAPDLALEFQPLWWFYFRKKGLRAYRESSKLEKILSTTSISLATAKMDGLNHMGIAIKVNLYKEHDPYLDHDLQGRYKAKEKQYLSPLKAELESLKRDLLSAQDEEDRKEIMAKITRKEFEIKQSRNVLMDEFQGAGKDYFHDKWNMDMVDFAFGVVNKYNNGALDSLKMRFAGYGLWINGAKGIGNNGLLTGMIRLNRVRSNSDVMIGASYRYGSEKFNVFAELVYNRYGNNAENGFHPDEVFGQKRDLDIGTGWYEFGEGESYSMYTISYGGDFRLRHNIMLNFSLRTQIKKGIGFERFIPVANLVCLMH